MRIHYAIAIAAAVLLGFGVKVFFFSAPAGADSFFSVNTATVDVYQKHRNIENLPVQEFQDMSLVFPNEGREDERGHTP